MSRKTESQRAAADKYLREKVDTIAVRVKKGKKKIVQEHAKTHGESVNSFVNRAIDEAIARDQLSE